SEIARTNSAAAEGIEKLGFRIQRRAGDAAPERAIAARARMSLGARAPDDGRRARLLTRTVAQDGGPRMGRPGAARVAWRRRTQLRRFGGGGGGDGPRP